jgi:hypothetical protein
MATRRHSGSTRHNHDDDDPGFLENLIVTTKMHNQSSFTMTRVYCLIIQRAILQFSLVTEWSHSTSFIQEKQVTHLSIYKQEWAYPGQAA